MSVPTIIVPILNRPELLDRLLCSIDHPVDRVVVIDNGDVVDPFWGSRHLTPYKFHVIKPGHNIGVAASWNLGIQTTPNSPWWLVVNSDIEFGPGDLARWEETVQPRAGILYKMLGLACFGITAPVLSAAGWFDAAITPAYNEDIDYCRRCDLAGIIQQEAGFTGTHVGSATIMADPELRRRNGETHMANDAYYAEKWGGSKQGGETFTTPFNKGGHVGDWRLDIERLRRQSWEKP